MSRKGSITMNKKIRMTAAALAAVTAMSCAGITAYADRIKIVDGVAYRYSDSGESKGLCTGWVKTSAGKKYLKNGKYITNKWLTKKNGARFYLNAEGIMETGWVHAGKAWYYVDAQNGALTGEQTLGGHVYSFSDKGKWNGIYDKYPFSKLANRLDKKVYGGLYYLDGMCVVQSVDGKAEAACDKIIKGISSGIVFLKAKYSMYEILEVRKDLEENHPGIWTGTYTDEMKNRLVVQYTAEQKAALDKYISNLDDPDIIITELTDGIFYDD